MPDKLLKMGEYNTAINDLLGIDIEPMTIYRSTGLPSHMIKRRHFKCLQYVDFIPEILSNPDYVGINPNESGSESIEFIKCFKFDVLLGVKLDKDNHYLYVSTMHDIQEAKVNRRLHSGRLKVFEKSVDK